ncbi:MAG: hypothetical protein ACKVHE_18825 [Planctomycetales bacterium]|jgi:hypothetical protein
MIRAIRSENREDTGRFMKACREQTTNFKLLNLLIGYRRKSPPMPGRANPQTMVTWPAQQRHQKALSTLLK